MRILIVKLSAFGDVIHALPVVKMIKAWRQDAEVHWAVDEEFAPLLAHVEDLDRIIPFPIRRWKKNGIISLVPDIKKCISEFRRTSYDIAIDIQGNLKSGIVISLSNASVKVGFARDGVRETPNLLFTNRKVALTPDDVHITRKYLRVVSGALGCSVPLDGLHRTIVPHPSVVDKLRTMVEREGINVTVHHGTTWETKGLSEEKWIRIIGKFLEEVSGRVGNLSVYMTWGSEGERERAVKIIDGVRGITGGETERFTIALAPQMDLGELISFLSLMDLVLGPDTGPVHLAAALGVKTVSFYRVTNAERNAPLGHLHRYIQADVDCSGCMKRECDIAERCEEAVSVELFSRHILELLA